MCCKKFSTYGVHVLRKCIEFMHFYSCPSPPLKTSVVQVEFFERGGRSYDLLYENSIKKCDDDLEH